MSASQTFIESLKTGVSNPKIEVLKKETYSHKGQERTQYTIRKLRSKRNHYVFKFENGGFKSCIAPSF